MRKIFPRDFFETKEGFIFSAVLHEENSEVVSFLRYYPSSAGNKVINNKRYKKVSSTEESFNFLKRIGKYIKKYDSYELQVVNVKDIRKVYFPERKFSEILYDENHPLHKHVEILNDTFKNIKLGITGSVLLDAFDENSDIDVTVYGRKNFFKAREILKESDLKISKDMMKIVYKRRKPCIDFETFYLHESRKYNKGIVHNKIFDLLIVNYPNEIFKDAIYDIKRIGRRVKRLKVIDDTYVFDYPSVYITSGDVKYVICYTHTYVGQAFEGEEIIVSGILEKINDKYYRMIVGSTREAYNEYIISKSLLEKSTS